MIKNFYLILRIVVSNVFMPIIAVPPLLKQGHSAHFEEGNMHLNIYGNILKFGDMGFSVVFLVELILKLIGYEWKEYFSSGFNIFDAVIIIFCFLDRRIQVHRIEHNLEQNLVDGFCMVFQRAIW